MGIKDICYAALFDKNDLPYLYRYAEKVRITHSQQLVDDFNNTCQRKVDDHNPIINGIELLQASKAEDIATVSGLAICCAQIIGQAISRWRYMGKGTGTTAPAAPQTILTTEVTPRIDMGLFGWREYASTSLRYLAIFGESIATITVNEAGIFDATTAGIMLNRNVFLTLPISHTVNVTGFVISSIIEFVPVM